MKNVYIFLAVLVVLAVSVKVGLFINNKYFVVKDNIITTTEKLDPKNGIYTIDGIPVALINSVSEVEAAPGSASKITTKYFGNEVRADLDKDGREDVAFLLTQETGGTGVFYYFVAQLNKAAGPIGSQAIFIGDRIAPQSTSINENKVIIVNYAERKIGEDFSVLPSVGKSIWLKLDAENLQFGEVMQNFEGEADPDKMSLDMKTWVWEKTIYNNDPKEKISFGKRYSIIFQKKDRTFSATTDCNNIGGKYKIASDDGISFVDMVSTQMFCEGSKEADFTRLLGDVEKFKFTSKGELYLVLKFDEGTLVFK